MKYLVVSAEKTNRGCYEIYGWSSENKRGVYQDEDDNRRFREIRVISQAVYLKDFGEWDLPICKKRLKAILKDKACQYTF